MFVWVKFESFLANKSLFLIKILSTFCLCSAGQVNSSDISVFEYEDLTFETYSKSFQESRVFFRHYAADCMPSF